MLTRIQDATVDFVMTIGDGEFDSIVLEGKGPIVVEFMSYGCGHCRVLEPILQQVAQLAKAVERIYRVNIAADPVLADNYQVEGTPTLVMFLNGRECGRAVGPSPTVENILEIIQGAFISHPS